MGRNYDIDHLSEYYSGMFESSEYIATIAEPFIARVTSEDLSKLKALSGKPIFKIGTWPVVKPWKEKGCKSWRGKKS